MDEAKHAQDAEKRAMERRLAENPFDTEAQAKIEEIIRQENVHRNFETAMEVGRDIFARFLGELSISPVPRST